MLMKLDLHEFCKRVKKMKKTKLSIKLSTILAIITLTLSYSITTAYAAESAKNTAVQTEKLDSIYTTTEDGYIVADEVSQEDLSKMLAVNESRDHYTVNDNGDISKLSDELQDWVYQMCAEYGISGYEKLVMSKLYCESGYDANCKSYNKNGTYDSGLAQINSSNHSWLRRELGITDFYDPYQSIRAGVYMLSKCLKENNFNEEMALVAYNSGRNGIKQSSYSRKVIRIKDSCIVNA